MGEVGFEGWEALAVSMGSSNSCSSKNLGDRSSKGGKAPEGGRLFRVPCPPAWDRPLTVRLFQDPERQHAAGRGGPSVLAGAPGW